MRCAPIAPQPAACMPRPLRSGWQGPEPTMSYMALKRSQASAATPCRGADAFVAAVSKFVYHSSTTVLPLFYHSSATLLPLFCHSSATILPQFCHYSTAILPLFDPLFYLNYATILSHFCRCSTFCLCSFALLLIFCRFSADFLPFSASTLVDGAMAEDEDEGRGGRGRGGGGGLIRARPPAEGCPTMRERCDVFRFFHWPEGHRQT